MFQILILLAAARLQEMYADNSPIWHWALGYSLFSGVFSGYSNLLAILIHISLFFAYACGYFALLRRVTDHVFLWSLVWLGGALMPILAMAALFRTASQ